MPHPMHGNRTQLTPKEAEALELQASGLSYFEIAAILDIAPRAVGKRLTRARRVISRRKRENE